MSKPLSGKYMGDKNGQKPRRFFRKKEPLDSAQGKEKKSSQKPKKPIVVKSQNKVQGEAKRSRLKFPSIPRTIPVWFVNFSNFVEKHWIAIGISLVTLFLFSLVVITGLDTLEAYKQKKQIETQRKTLEEQVVYWEDVAQKHKDYRDAYYQLALLEYQLRDFDKARAHLKKVFELDPNYTPGKKLEEVLR